MTFGSLLLSENYLKKKNSKQNLNLVLITLNMQECSI